MNGAGHSLSVWLILNTRSFHSIRVPSKADGFWAELNQVFAIFTIMPEPYVNTKRQGVVPQKRKLLKWMLRVNVQCRKRRKMLMLEAHCGKFPKHWQTCALNIEESSGTVYLPAASHRFQISSNNLTCHFMVWYFCETWRPQTPNTSDTRKTI